MSIFVYKKEVPAVGAYCPVLELHCFYDIKLKKLCQSDGYYNSWAQKMVVPTGLEPVTQGSSGLCSTN